MQIDREVLADLKLTLNWQDSTAHHTEIYDAVKVNFWRDILPRRLFHELMGHVTGDQVTLSFEAGAALVGYHQRSLFSIRKSQFQLQSETGKSASVRVGRFYPKGILKDVSGVFPQNREPFRCVGSENGHLTVDFNHPLVGRSLTLDAEVKDVTPKSHERGGTSIDWIEVLADGPGMQSRWRRQPTDFFEPDAFGRSDTTNDSVFYQTPRMVHHLDVTSRAIISDLYGRLLLQGGRVLDLMSSWVSHLPKHLPFDRVVGLGLNQDELDHNPDLNQTLVHDLNHNSILPFDSETFDGIICTASIEYLIDPMTVIKEAARVLRPEGVFVVTFSNRWFPSKAVNIWSQLHPFERVGLVMELFMRSKQFKRLNTLSYRGLPRDPEDKYYGQIVGADPVFAVWAYKV